MIQGGEAGRLFPLPFCSGLSSGSSLENTVSRGRSRILALCRRFTEKLEGLQQHRQRAADVLNPGSNVFSGVSGSTIIGLNPFLGAQQGSRVCDNHRVTLYKSQFLGPVGYTPCDTECLVSTEC